MVNAQVLRLIESPFGVHKKWHTIGYRAMPRIPSNVQNDKLSQIQSALCHRYTHATKRIKVITSVYQAANWLGAQHQQRLDEN